MNPFGLHFDGDLRRIYEVPENSSYTTDADGYRIYTPNGVGVSSIRFTSTYLWSRYSDFYFNNNWSTKALSKSGGAYRDTDVEGNDIYATFDLRLQNLWLFVPANYPHTITCDGNLFNEPTLKMTQDNSRITSSGVSFNINSSDSLQITKSPGVDAENVWNFLESNVAVSGSMGKLIMRLLDHARAANTQTKKI